MLFPLDSKAEDTENQFEASLAYIKSSLKSAMNEAKLGGEKSGFRLLMKLLEDIYDAVALMLKLKNWKTSWPLDL